MNIKNRLVKLEKTHADRVILDDQLLSNDPYAAMMGDAP